jgi:hypothetical protein
LEKVAATVRSSDAMSATVTAAARR